MTGYSNARYITERRRRDAGMTLPEVLICVTVMGLITTVLAATIMVTFRQADATEGRVNVARAEQSIDTWLPADLASTDVGRVDLPAVDTSPAASPCGNCGGIDLSGANGLQLAWSTMAGSPPVEVVTRVQYQYIQVGAEWQLQRISCVGASPCRMNVVLHELEPPPNLGDLTNPYNPNADRPVWVMDVAAPQDPAELQLSDNARRIVVTVNGGGAGEGAGGGVNQINLTAGGIETSEVSADEFTVPSFVRANSRCGGPVTLIVDDSGSIGGAVDSVVDPGVRAFIEAFRGTPTKVQIIQFSTTATAIGPGGSAWHKYVDMTDDVAVDQLLTAVNALDSDGGTNWEEAFFHTLKNSDGTAAAVLPKRIVFFTDGIPTFNRTGSYSGSPTRNGSLVHYNAGEYRRGTGWWPAANGSAFNQESFDRADVILDAHPDIDRIFVGVGPDLNANVSWIYNPAVYTNLNAQPASSTSKLASDVIAFLLANGPTGQVPALYDGAAYTNPETADFYLQSSFDTIAFAAAMKASALKDCGGTLTLQTRFENGTPVNNEFVYENVRYRDNTGTAIVADPRRVTTSSAFRTGTFDFQLPATVPYYSVDVVPQELQTLNLYTPVGWSCRAGATPKSTVPLVIPSSPWTGITVDVRANEAVSCILTVRAA